MSMLPLPPGLSNERVRGLTLRAVRLAQFTIAYNVLEGSVAVAAGAVSGLHSLVGFGLESATESAVAILVAMRLAARLRDGEGDRARERRSLRAIGMVFLVLAAYITMQGLVALVQGDVPEESLVGVLQLAASALIMPSLALAKRRVGLALGGDRLVLADAAETLICVMLSVSTLAALIAYHFSGAIWLDPLAGFLIALFAVNAGRDALSGEL